MKVTRKAKRRWFTKANNSRIRWNDAFGSFTTGCTEAFLEAVYAGSKISEFVQNILREQFAETVLRPVIQNIIKGLPPTVVKPK